MGDNDIKKNSWESRQADFKEEDQKNGKIHPSCRK